MGRKSTRIPAPPPTQPPSPPGPHQETSVEHAAYVPCSRAAVWDGMPSASSTEPSPMDKQAWSAAATDLSSQTTYWGADHRPSGGFLNYLRNPLSSPLPQEWPNQRIMSQNFQFDGGPTHYSPFLAPRPSVVTGVPSPSLPKSSTPITPSGSQRCSSAENGDENVNIRTEKRLAWTTDKDKRLMSAWLYNSNDPINGNNKSDKY